MYRKPYQDKSREHKQLSELVRCGDWQALYEFFERGTNLPSNDEISAALKLCIRELKQPSISPEERVNYIKKLAFLGKYASANEFSSKVLPQILFSLDPEKRWVSWEMREACLEELRNLKDYITFADLKETVLARLIAVIKNDQLHKKSRVAAIKCLDVLIKDAGNLGEEFQGQIVNTLLKVKTESEEIFQASCMVLNDIAPQVSSEEILKKLMGFMSSVLSLEDRAPPTLASQYMTRNIVTLIASRNPAIIIMAIRASEGIVLRKILQIFANIATSDPGTGAIPAALHNLYWHVLVAKETKHKALLQCLKDFSLVNGEILSALIEKTILAILDSKYSEDDANNLLRNISNVITLFKSRITNNCLRQYVNLYLKHIKEICTSSVVSGHSQQVEDILPKLNNYLRVIENLYPEVIVEERLYSVLMLWLQENFRSQKKHDSQDAIAASLMLVLSMLEKSLERLSDEELEKNALLNLFTLMELKQPSIHENVFILLIKMEARIHDKALRSRIINALISLAQIARCWRMPASLTISSDISIAVVSAVCSNEIKLFEGEHRRAFISQLLNTRELPNEFLVEKLEDVLRNYQQGSNPEKRSQSLMLVDFLLALLPKINADTIALEALGNFLIRAISDDYALLMNHSTETQHTETVENRTPGKFIGTRYTQWTGEMEYVYAEDTITYDYKTYTEISHPYEMQVVDYYKKLLTCAIKFTNVIPDRAVALLEAIERVSKTSDVRQLRELANGVLKKLKTSAVVPAIFARPQTALPDSSVTPQTTSSMGYGRG